MKTILRWRWVFVALLVALFFWLNRGQFLLEEHYLWAFGALFLFVSLVKQLNRIEQKLDALSAGENTR